MTMMTRDYWTRTRDSAAANIAHITGSPVPHTEDEVKSIVARSFRGTCREAADAVVEAVKWVVACHMTKASDQALQ